MTPGRDPGGIGCPCQDGLAYATGSGCGEAEPGVRIRSDRFGRLRAETYQERAVFPIDPLLGARTPAVARTAGRAVALPVKALGQSRVGARRDEYGCSEPRDGVRVAGKHGG